MKYLIRIGTSVSEKWISKTGASTNAKPPPIHPSPPLSHSGLLVRFLTFLAIFWEDMGEFFYFLLHIYVFLLTLFVINISKDTPNSFCQFFTYFPMTCQHTHTPVKIWNLERILLVVLILLFNHPIPIPEIFCILFVSFALLYFIFCILYFEILRYCNHLHFFSCFCRDCGDKGQGGVSFVEKLWSSIWWSYDDDDDEKSWKHVQCV